MALLWKFKFKFILPVLRSNKVDTENQTEKFSFKSLLKGNKFSRNVYSYTF